MITETIPNVCNEEGPSPTEAPLVAKIKLSFGKHTFETKALLDTGATITTDGIIDYGLAQQLSKQFGLPLKETVKKSAYRDFQGRPAKARNRLFLPRMKIFEHEQPSVVLACMDLGTHSVILGERWMRQHGMTPSPPHGAMMHDPRFCTHVGTLEKPKVWKLKEVPTPSGENDFSQIIWPKEWTKSEARHDATGAPGENAQGPQGEEPSPTDVSPEVQRPGVITPKEPQWKVKVLERKAVRAKKRSERPPKVDVKIIGAKAFYAACKEAGAEISMIDVQSIIETVRSLSEKDFVESNAQKLPEVYRDLIKVVSREASDILPEHNENDCRIELLEGKTAEMIGVEPMRKYTAEEYAALRDFIKENLGTRFLRSSAAGWGCPPLLVKKPDGSLRVCVDYRRLNAITKRDAYPLPLIDQILTLLKDTKMMTRLDIRHAFYRTRMHEDSEELTTFRSPMGAYCFRVMPFGITNGPSVFQRYINKALMKCGLGHVVVAYADDVIIFSREEKQHVQDVRKVLSALIDAGLQVDLKKCDFHVTETKLLGMIVSTEGIKMDPAKVEAILDWETPKTVTHVQEFLGFCNFYRRFIESCGEIAKPLTILTGKGRKFEWGEAQQKAFDGIKEKIALQPTLYHYRRDRQAIVEADSSDWAYGAVLSQYDDNGVLRPIAFLSKNMTPAELNYAIYDKELLAIVRALETWRAELEGTEIPIEIFTDHKALEYFSTKRKLTRRHERWIQILAPYNFRIQYRKGSENGKADALSRRPNGEPTQEMKDELQTHVLLPREKFAVAAVGEDESDGNVIDEVVEANRKSKELSVIRHLLSTASGQKRYPGYAEESGLLTFRGALCVPAQEAELITRLTKEVHDGPASGHPGYRKTMDLLRKGYYWPKMRDTVRRYVRNCGLCNRNKHSREKYQGLLHPLPIPVRPWVDLSCDFITGLPKCQGYDAIFTVVDRFSKMRHFIPCRKDATAEDLARLFICHVWRYHGLPRTIVSDRGPQFISEFWHELCRILRIKRVLSTAHHPQTDGQSEIANKEVLVHIRMYCNHNQDDWVDWLPTAEFSDNVTTNASTKVSPFALNYGYDPLMSFDWSPNQEPPRNRDQVDQRSQAKEIAERMDKIWREAAENLKDAQETAQKFANRHRKDVTYSVGDKVFLSTKTLKTSRPAEKLEQLWLGPYPVVEVVGHSYKLELPKSMKIHPVIHTDRLKRAPNDPLPGQKVPEQGPVEVTEDGVEIWEVEKILNSSLGKPGARGRKPKNPGLWYRVKWFGYEQDDLDWYPAEDFEGSAELLKEWHDANPNRPGPPKDLSRWLAGASPS
jgi:hypothetical protein